MSIRFHCVCCLSTTVQQPLEPGDLSTGWTTRPRLCDMQNMTTQQALSEPLAIRFAMAGHEGDNGNVVDIGEFLSLMRHEYSIVSTLLRQMRKAQIEDKISKNIDRIAGLTLALSVVEGRAAVVEAVYKVLGQPAYDPLQQSAQVARQTLARCVCGDFQGTTSEVSNHVRMALIMEDFGDHRVVQEN